MLGADRHSNFADTIVAYNLAEGMSLGHDCILVLPGDDLRSAWLSKLPYNLSLVEEEISNSSSLPMFCASVSRFCCSYDLARRYEQP